MLKTNDGVRAWMLSAAAAIEGVVPFQRPLRVPEDSGWFRMSVGAVSESQVNEAMPRLEAALTTLK